MKKILHFENDPFIGDMYKSTFEAKGFSYARYATPTKNPMTIVRKERPDLIVMNMLFPGIDGFVATEMIRADRLGKTIPIIGLSNLGQKRDIDRALKLGMVQYHILAKVLPSQFAIRVTNFLETAVPPKYPKLAAPKRKVAQKASAAPVVPTVKTPAAPVLPKRGFEWWRWITIVLAGVVYPGFSIWSLTPFYQSWWSILSIILTVYGIIAAVQLLNKNPQGTLNVILFYWTAGLSTIAAFISSSATANDWTGWYGTLIVLFLTWLLASFARRGEYAQTALQSIDNVSWWKRPFVFLRSNPIGQLAVYSFAVVIVVSVVYFQPLTPMDQLPKKDMATQKDALAWLETHPDSFEDLMQHQTGQIPTLVPQKNATALDTRTLVRNVQPAIVSLFTPLNIGTGFFISKDGILITSEHVVYGAEDVVVVTSTGQQLAIEKIHRCDEGIDYCILQVATTDASFLPIAATESYAAGDTVATVGSANGLRYSVSTGTLSAVREYDNIGPVLQFTAPISPGNSGGPLLNMNGEVLGIITAMLPWDGAQNVNLAISLNKLSLVK